VPSVFCVQKPRNLVSSLGPTMLCLSLMQTPTCSNIFNTEFYNEYLYNCEISLVVIAELGTSELSRVA
jgi:hypothetical protein